MPVIVITLSNVTEPALLGDAAELLAPILKKGVAHAVNLRCAYTLQLGLQKSSDNVFPEILVMFDFFKRVHMETRFTS